MILAFSSAMLITACTKAAKPELIPKVSPEQQNCEHEWTEVDWHTKGMEVVVMIYCPKCKLETNVNLKEWKKIQADMEYKKENK
jgi:hypothetical protein